MFHLLIFSLFSSFLYSDALTRAQVIMGTFCTISLEQTDKIQSGFEYLKMQESVLSSYQKEALVYRLNHQKSILINQTLKEVLTLSKIYHAKTDGYFDITIGSITKELYHFGEDAEIPKRKKIQDAVVNIDGIYIQENVIKIDENITIDLGGIGKGYAVDKLSEHYQKQGVEKGKIALSGDIRCFNPCEVLIESPFAETPFVSLSSKIDNLSISTSGTYRRFVKNPKNHHLLNPKTKQQGRDFSSVTILTKNNNTLCDSFATAVSVMPFKKALDFLGKETNIGYILIMNNGKVLHGNLDKFVKVKWLNNRAKEKN